MSPGYWRSHFVKLLNICNDILDPEDSYVGSDNNAWWHGPTCSNVRDVGSVTVWVQHQAQAIKPTYFTNIDGKVLLNWEWFGHWAMPSSYYVLCLSLNHTCYIDFYQLSCAQILRTVIQNNTHEGGYECMI